MVQFATDAKRVDILLQAAESADWGMTNSSQGLVEVWSCDGTVKRNLGVSLEDSEGNLIGSTLVVDYGDQGFPPCEDVSEGKFEPGDSYESCTLFLVPEGIEVGQVSFLSDKGADTEPEFVYWDAD
jgi:hypothetical protein